MTRPARLIATFVLLAIPALALAADKSAPFDGEWRTSIGTVTLKQTGNAVTGTYGNVGQFTLKGTVTVRKLTFEYHEGQATGDANWTLDDSGHAFAGQFQIRGGQGGEWNGWRPDPATTKAKAANVAGLWLTELGLMELEQTGDKVTGHYAVGGMSEIEGTVTGRRLEFTVKSFRPGKGWFDLSADGKSLAGAANTDGFNGWYGWRGRKAPEFARHAKLVPGKIVDGSTKNLLTYCVRAPDGYKPGDAKKWPAVVVLHGSNMSAKAYVNTIAAAWPDIARDFVLIGINGERPSNLGGGTDEEPAFNYTYINYVGRSTFKGYPGTDRESPALVAEALDDLREAYPVSRYFVGGHSQGGFLTYSLLMNFPEKIAGAFPISAGVIFQCEPTAYDDAPLKAAQRAVPLAIVHSKQDGVVAFSMGEYAATIFGEANWPAFRFFADNTGAAHMFARLPVNQAIRWLEAQSSDDPAKLLDFAEQRVKANGYRDAIAAVNRARGLTLNEPAKQRLDRLTRQIDSKAVAGARQFLAKIRDAKDNSWVDGFLTYRDDFEFAPAAKEVMDAFNALRARQDPPSQKAMNQARAAFQQGQRDDGYAKYKEIVDKYPAATSYRNVKRWLAERK
jgi:predicted esterase